MSGLQASLVQLLARLDVHGARYAVVGGLAVSARTEPRFTRDVDICLSVDHDAAAEALLRALQGDGYRVLALAEQETTGRLAMGRLNSPMDIDEGVVLDLLFASSGIETEVVASAERLELFEGLVVPIATPASLIALKVLSRDDQQRPQDRVDLVALLAVATAEDIAEARTLLELIGSRGYARGRDLNELLEQALTWTDRADRGTGSAHHEATRHGPQGASE